MAASIKIEFDDGSKVMQRTLNVHDSTTPAGYVNNIDIDIFKDNNLGIKANASVKVFNWKSDAEFDFYYENEAVANYIYTNSFQKVGFQLPDYYLVDAPKILKHVSAMINAIQQQQNDHQGITSDLPVFQPLLFILGDTSYGECCVDEVAATHLGADAVIHYGRSCLQQNSRLPVKYIFGKSKIDVKHFIEQFLNGIDEQKTYIILHDVEYAHGMNEINTILNNHKEIKNVYTSITRNNNNNNDIVDNDNAEGKTFLKIQGQFVEISSTSTQNDIIHDNTIFIYIGTQTPRLIRLIMRYNMHKFLVYDPHHCSKLNESNTNSTLLLQPAMNKVGKLVNKRYFQVQKAKDASIFGILVGTLSVARYRDVLVRVKRLLKCMGRKYYTFIVGKINVAKLANHSEVDVYVLIACPENSLLDNKEFYKPIVTPFELEVALNPKREWDGTYTTDFADILLDQDGNEGNKKPEAVGTAGRTGSLTNNILSDGKVQAMELPPDEEKDGDTDVPYMSLIDGKMKLLRHNAKSDETSTSNELVTYAEHSTLAVHTASEYMNTKRTFKGLEQKLGETKPMKAVQGLSGIAQSYKSEPQVTTSDSTTKTGGASSKTVKQNGTKINVVNSSASNSAKNTGNRNTDGDSDSDEEAANIVMIKPLIDSDSSEDSSDEA
jgi:diphthamide biosynthesis protein 2